MIQKSVQFLEGSKKEGYLMISILILGTFQGRVYGSVPENFLRGFCKFHMFILQPTLLTFADFRPFFVMSNFFQNKRQAKETS